MNAPFKTPETEAPLWDLSDLYGSRDDARLAADMTQARALVDDLNGLQGRLAAQRADPSALGATLDRAITLYEQASDRLGALGAYAFLAASTARDDAGAQGFEADVREKITAIATPTVWLTLEINQIDDAELNAALAAHPAAARWRPWLRRVRAMKPHELSAQLETFIAERGPITAQWPRLFDEQMAALRAHTGRGVAGGETLPLAEALNRLSDAKPARRKAAAGAAPARRGRPPKAQAKAAGETRDLILDAAEDLFSKHGFYGVTIREVAREAGVDTALVHYYFGAKRDLFDAVFLRRAEVWNSERVDAVNRYAEQAGSDMTLEGLLDAFLRPPFEWSLKGGPDGSTTPPWWPRPTPIPPSAARRWRAISTRRCGG